MHDETIAIHAGYEADGTRAVAVPIYMSVAHEFIDADHANSIMDLAIPGFHYNRINNPTNDVLETRIAALEDGTAALVVASGMAAVSYAILTVATAGSNFVVAPQLYGATYTYFALFLALPAALIALTGKTPQDLVLALQLTSFTALVYAIGLGWALAF